MNKERIAKLREVIIEDIEYALDHGEQPHFDMDHWFRTTEDDRPMTYAGSRRHQFVGNLPTELACGTTFCAAGWAVYLWRAEAEPGELIEDAAQRILGLTDEQAEIFYQDDDVALDVLERWSA